MRTHDVKRLVAYYVKKYETRNPFRLAEYLNVFVHVGSLGSRAGCYMFLKNHKCIFLNEDLNEQERMLVMAHELAHSIMHRKENCYFIRNKTLLLTSEIETEANMFAAELLIPDDLIYENPGMSKSQIARLAGYDERIMDFKKI
nr:MAG TPA: IrrE protein [Bacteriophage sp.]